MSEERSREIRCWRTRTVQDHKRWTSTHHLISIALPPMQVLAIADDVPRWPELFPPCQAVEILERQDNTTRFRITAYANERLVSWLSQRTVYKEQGRVDFVQLEPFAPLAVMKGTWWFKEVPGGTLIDFIHHFTLDTTLFAGIDDPAFIDAELALCRAVDTNSHAELRVIRDICEQSLERKDV
jgi:aromatase